VNDIRQMIEETRSAVATAVNAGLTMLYWDIGRRIREEILKGERGDTDKRLLLLWGKNWQKSLVRDSKRKTCAI